MWEWRTVDTWQNTDADCRRRTEFARVTVKRRFSAGRLSGQSEARHAAGRLARGGQARSAAGITRHHKCFIHAKMSTTGQLQFLTQHKITLFTNKICCITLNSEYVRRYFCLTVSLITVSIEGSTFQVWCTSDKNWGHRKDGKASWRKIYILFKNLKQCM